MARRRDWTVPDRLLPSDELARREPRLAGVRENPVFRMIAWKRRETMGAECALRLEPPVLLLALSILFERAGGGLWSGAELFFCLHLALMRGMNWKSDPLSPPAVPGFCVGDLRMAGVSADVFARGLWASSFPRRRWRISGALAVFAFAVFAASAFVPIFRRPMPTWLGLWLCGEAFGCAPFQPHVALAGWRRAARAQRRRLEHHLRPWYRNLLAAILSVGRTLVVAAAVLGIAMGVLHVVLTSDYGRGPALDAIRRAPRWATGALAFSLGLIPGALRGAWARARAEATYRDLREELAESLTLIDRAREAEHEAAESRRARAGGRR